MIIRSLLSNDNPFNSTEEIKTIEDLIAEEYPAVHSMIKNK